MQFPTMAERAIATYNEANSTRTVQFSKVAKQMGATRDAGEWVFDDDSVVVVYGRGKGHWLTAMLP